MNVTFHVSGRHSIGGFRWFAAIEVLVSGKPGPSDITSIVSLEVALERSHSGDTMKKVDVVRAWRDAEYRSSLSEDVRQNLPASPAGIANIDDDVLKSITGGCGGSTCSCGGVGTNPNFSCVTPPANCP